MQHIEHLLERDHIMTLHNKKSMAVLLFFSSSQFEEKKNCCAMW